MTVASSGQTSTSQQLFTRGCTLPPPIRAAATAFMWGYPHIHTNNNMRHWYPLKVPGPPCHAPWRPQPRVSASLSTLELSTLRTFVLSPHTHTREESKRRPMRMSPHMEHRDIYTHTCISHMLVVQVIQVCLSVFTHVCKFKNVHAQMHMAHISYICICEAYACMNAFVPSHVVPQDCQE